eukprot:EG_transcript_58974
MPQPAGAASLRRMVSDAPPRPDWTGVLLHRRFEALHPPFPLRVGPLEITVHNQRAASARQGGGAGPQRRLRFQDEVCCQPTDDETTKPPTATSSNVAAAQRPLSHNHRPPP